MANHGRDRSHRSFNTNYDCYVGQIVDFCLYRELRKRERRVMALLADINKKVSILTAVRIEFYTTIDGQLTKVDKMVTKVSQHQPLSIVAKDVFGNIATVDGAPAWSLSDPSLAILDIAADGMSAVLKPIGPVGSLIVQATADADMGAGVVPILASLPVDLIAGTAVSVEMAAGAPIDV